MNVLLGNKMIPYKYSKIMMLLVVCLVNTTTKIACAPDSNSENKSEGVIAFSDSDLKGNANVIKPGNYSTSELRINDIKSMEIPDGFEVLLSKSEDFDDDNETLSCPTLDNLNTSTGSTSSNDNTEQVDNSTASNSNSSDTSTNEVKENTQNTHTLNNIDLAKYKYLYVAKVDLNNEDGIAIHDEYDTNTCEYFGRKIQDMKELDSKEKEQLKEITIDNSPEFKGLPDLTQYKELKNIKMLFNVLQNKDKTFIENEYIKIINYIDKVHPLTVIEMQGELPSYEKTQNGKYFGFNIETFPSLPTDIKEIHLINCKKLSNIDFSKYKDLQKLYMYGSTLEAASNDQWKKMIEQIYNLSINTTENKQEQYKILGFITQTRTVKVDVIAKLTHIQLPKAFTGEIPKISNPSKTQIQYLSALGATSIAKEAFDKNTSLKELYCPNVKEVKDNAFRYCYNMENVSLDKCEVLQRSSFDANKKLKSMHLPVVKKVCQWALVYTTRNDLKIGDLNDVTFKNSKEAGVYLPLCEELGERALGDDNAQVQFVTINLPVCKTIGKNAMKHLKQLKEVNIPEVETIGVSAFENDGELTKVGDIKNISDSDPAIFLPKVKSIADYAFKNDDQSYVKDKIKAQNNTIKSIILPECESIGRDAFMRYRVMEKLSIPKCKSIGKLAFYDCYKLQKLEAPLLETIEDRAFLYASSAIKSFKTVDNKEEIDDFLELPKVKTIGVQVFGGDNNHKIGQILVKLPECTQISDNALQGSRIQNLEAPKISNSKQTTTILSLTSSNITFNKSLLEI